MNILTLFAVSLLAPKLTTKHESMVFIYFSGQVVSAEILMASDHGCPIEMHQIKIDKCDEMYDENCQGDTTMPFHRARYDPTTGQSPNNPREQVDILLKYYHDKKHVF